MTTDIRPASDRHGATIRSGLTAVGNCHRVAVGVADREAAVATIDEALGRAGLGVIARSERSVSLDPADMDGVRFELVDV